MSQKHRKNDPGPSQVIFSVFRIGPKIGYHNPPNYFFPPPNAHTYQADARDEDFVLTPSQMASQVQRNLERRSQGQVDQKVIGGQERKVGEVCSRPLWPG